MGWPLGPGSLDKLFLWPAYNATKLLCESDRREQHIQNFLDLAAREIWVNDSYSGTGSGASTLHLQYDHMVRQVLS